MSQNKQNKIQIKYENAINYKPNPDSDYFVSDLLQNHLKLRVLQSGSKVWVYDYIYNNILFTIFYIKFMMRQY